MRVKRQLETPLPARPEDAGFGATRSLIGRRHWKSEDSGQPGASVLMPLKDAKFEATRIPSPARPEDAGNGATRNLIGRRYWRSMLRGNPELDRR